MNSNGSPSDESERPTRTKESVDKGVKNLHDESSNSREDEAPPTLSGSEIEGQVNAKSYSASVYPGPDNVLDVSLGAAAEALEDALHMPVWLLIQQPPPLHDYCQLDEPVRKGLFLDRRKLSKEQPVALVIDSPGGSAKAAYQLATMMRRHCRGFVAVIPRYAKSAATLLALGADEIFLGRDAELGPLDAQLLDREREDWASALDEVQALERLNVAALEQFDQAMMMLLERTGKKLDSLLPHALKYTTDMMRPLLERIDTVHYIRQSRVLKVAEEYAERLLIPKYGDERSSRIASRFVNNYPEHGFIIDRDEAGQMLDLAKMSDEVNVAIDALADVLVERSHFAIGRLIVEGGNQDVN